MSAKTVVTPTSQPIQRLLRLPSRPAGAAASSPAAAPALAQLTTGRGDEPLALDGPGRTLDRHAPAVASAAATANGSESRAVGNC